MRSSAIILIIVVIVIMKMSDAQNNDSFLEKLKAKVVLPTATVTSQISSSWSWANPAYRNSWRDWITYYDVYKVVASTSGDYTFTSKSSLATYGFLYYPTFNATSPSENTIVYGLPSGTDQQFQFTGSLGPSVAYYLVVTTSGYLQSGDFQVIVTGPAKLKFTQTTDLLPSMPNITFQSSFTHLQPALEDFCGSSYYYSYDVFSIVPKRSGKFTIETVAQYGAAVRLYSPTFNPLATMLNMIAFDNTDDFRSRRQFNVNLVASNQYYLVLSYNTYYYFVDTPDYSVTFRGPSTFTMIKQTGVLFSRVKASSSLTQHSQQYSRGSSAGAVYYYKVFRITVDRLDIYSFVGNSNIGITGFLYMNSFSPSLYYQNQINSNSYYDSQAKFVTKAKMLSNTAYYLVVTTNNEKETGAFNITAAGPQGLTISAVAEASTWSVSVSSSLTASSPQFRRCQGSSSNYYYRLFKISVPNVGLYTVKSQGSLDAFGCLYMNQFDSNSADSNIIAYDDQNGGRNQFAMTMILNSNTVYYLAATTNGEGRTGSSKVTISGPARATISATNS